jgi:hypothetical protein
LQKSTNAVALLRVAVSRKLWRMLRALIQPEQLHQSDAVR